jgi:Protein of unknown function (DUF3421)
MHLNHQYYIGKVEMYLNQFLVQFQITKIIKKNHFHFVFIGEKKWVDWKSSELGIPENAFVGGSDGRNPLYMIRANTQWGTLPGKYNIALSSGHYSYDHKEYKALDFEVKIINNFERKLKQNRIFQVLTGSGMFWSDSNEGQRVFGGRNSLGETLYICKASIYGRYTPGKLHSGRCYIPYGHREHSFDSYLTLREF